MSAEKSVTELLGVNKDVLAQKCSTATRWLLESKLFGGKSTEEFVSHMTKTFTDAELMFLSIGYITDKTESIMNNDPAITSIIDKAAVKHNIPDPIVDIVKASLGIKKDVNPN